MSESRKVVSLAAERPGAKDAAEILRALAEQAERGEIVQLVAVYELQDGEMKEWESSSMARRKMAASLMEAAIWRMGFVREDY